MPNYRIELMVNCDLETLEKVVDAAFNACEEIVECAEQVIEADSGEVIDI